MVDVAQIEIVEDGSHVTVVGGGSLDLTNSLQFHDGLRKASEAAEQVTVDLRTADFIDTAIVQDLARAGVTMLKRDLRLKVLSREGAYPLRVLRISGFEGIMDIEVEAAGN
jgi:anti-anti-sigma factor